jgi:hypothetical protein
LKHTDREKPLAAPLFTLKVILIHVAAGRLSVDNPGPGLPLETAIESILVSAPALMVASTSLVNVLATGSYAAREYEATK